MYDACFRCWTSYASIIEWFRREIWSWVTRTWQECTRRKCKWWCACCNKWFCWLVTALVAVVTVIFEAVVIVVATVVCVVINAWCLVCTTICWLGCLLPALFNKDIDCAEACKSARGCSMVRVRGKTDIGGGESLLTSTRTPTVPGGGSGGTAPATGRDHHAELAETAATCGCREGKLGMLGAIGLCGAWLVVDAGTLAAFGWHEARVLAGFAFAGALVGKGFGMTRAWARLRAA